MSGETPKALWQRVAQTIRDRIATGQLTPGQRMPSGTAIAEEFGISRLTARRALSELEREGFLHIRHGAGTYVRDIPIPYNVGAITRFDQNLRAVGAEPSRELLRWWIEPADPMVAAALDLGEKSPVLALELGAFANGQPIGIGVRYACAARFAGFPEIFAETGSISKSLKRFGVEKYRRSSTNVSARLATDEEGRFLRCSNSQPVLSYVAKDQEVSGTSISIFRGCFLGGLVEVQFNS